MRLDCKKYAKLLCFIVVWAITACAPIHSPVDTEIASLHHQRATEMFVAGYTQIVEKYIEKIPPAQLAMEGIRGLGSIDPAITIKQTDDAIILIASDNEVSRFNTPGKDDIHGWADLTSQIWQKGRMVSPELFESSEEKLYEAVFDGALSKLDIYSRYAGLREATRNRARRDGFGGIGIRFKVSARSVHITRVLKNTPAERAALRVGDRILRIGSRPVEGFSIRDISDKLRGRIDSKVKLTILREGEALPKVFTLERHLILTPTVHAKYQDGISFIRISGFNQQTSNDLAKSTRQALKTHANKVKGIILDLRGNPGGLLNQSIRIANLFLSQGKIVSTRGRHPESVQYHEASGNDIAHGLPLVLLLDGKSASSSEVLAAALQDHGRAVIVGTTSFGKGTVQTVIQMPNSGEITLTWSRLYSPAGYILHGLGLHPSFCTSGNSTLNLEDLAQSLADEAHVRQVFKSWRSTGFYEHEQRSALRAKCPAERRKDRTEIRAAKKLLENASLYSRALALSSSGMNKALEEAVKIPK
jgi:carboxyl-terminal processing protease